MAVKKNVVGSSIETKNGVRADDRWRPPDEYRTVSLKAVAELLDTSRSSARRWMREAGIMPVAIGRGRNGAIRYRWPDIRSWLEAREQVQ
ncbi:MAG: helix-turn-helix domain-containing protein [Chloroflexi bacterium]|nr:helix-turn-helix domain-containing protein [Chloroflexota bacterium]